MAKYRKTALIEATQWNQMGDHPAVVEHTSSPTGFAIITLENAEIKHEVTPGDWIATGIQGEQWPIKPDIFAATYELVE